MRITLIIGLCLAIASPGMAEDPELTGVLKRTVKAGSPHEIELDGATGSFYLRGKVLKDIPDGTRIWVKGAIQTSLNDNRNDPTPATPMHWHIYMDVKECQTIKDIFERPTEARLQNEQYETTASLEAHLPGAAEKPTSSELGMVADALHPILDTLDPKPTVEYPDHGSSMVVTFRPQTYKIHGRSKSGEVSTEVYDRVGPSFTGFVLRVHLQPKGDVNQAQTPQTIHEPYWTTLLDVTPIENTDKQIYWGLSFSARTSKDLLDQIKEVLQQL